MTIQAERQAGFRDPKILLPFLLITLIWSSTWIVIKDQLGPGPGTGVPPPWSVTYRFLIASAAMFVIARASGVSLRIGRGGHALAAAIGVPQFALNFNFVYAAENYVTSGLCAVVFALLMVPNALGARLFFGRPIGGRFVAGSAVALVGVALLFVQEARIAAVPLAGTLVGIGYTMLGVLSASAANVMQLSEGARRRPITALLAWAMLYGALLDGTFAFAAYGPPVAETRLGYWLGLLYLGLFASALAFTLYFRIIRAVGPARAAYSSVLVPIIAMAISTLLEGYRWSALALAGGLFAIAGLWIALHSPRLPPAPPAD